MVNYFELSNIVDYDKNIICQIYKSNSDNFNLYNCNDNKINILNNYIIKESLNLEPIIKSLNLEQSIESHNLEQSIESLNLEQSIESHNLEQSIESHNLEQSIIDTTLKKNLNFKIGFFINNFLSLSKINIIFNYAFYTRYYNNNENIIIYNNDIDLSILNKFINEFNCFEITNLNEINNILFKNNITHLYSIGKTFISKNVINLIHLDSDNDIKNDSNDSNEFICKYALFTDYLNTHELPIIPFIIDYNKYDTNSNFRNDLVISQDAIIIGRDGEYNDFNIIEVFNAIKEILDIDNNIYFIFVNTKPFYIHDRILYLDKIIDNSLKVKFINSCDAMIHGKINGEIYSYEIAEFSILNKPIITCLKNDINTGHINILLDKALYYYDTPSLVNIFSKISHFKNIDFNWNACNDNLPEQVIKLFMKNFINNSY